MRSPLRIATAVLATLMLAVPAVAADTPTVSGVTVVDGTTHKLSDGSITVTGAADFTGHPDGTAPSVKVFTDNIADGVVLEEFIPEWQDLVAGHIGETPGEILFTWEVVDWPSDPLYVPEIVHFYWEFSLDGARFSLNASFNARGNGQGALRHKCETENNVTSCEPVPGALVTVSADGETDRITATVRRRDLKDEENQIVAVRGAELMEDVSFQGIASYTGAGLVLGAMGDIADQDRPYYLGNHVEAHLLPAAVTLNLDEWPPDGTTLAAPDGTFALDVPLDFHGDFKLHVRACGGQACGPVTSIPVTITDD